MAIAGLYVEDNAPMPDFARVLDATKSNISQTEYVSKHRLFFESTRRNEIKRLKSRGERPKDIPRKRLQVFTPIDDKTLPILLTGETRQFAYDANIPALRNKNSIIEAEDIELRFLLIPKICDRERQVNFSVLGEETQLEVDACRPRWESLSVRTLPQERPAHLRISCKDCASKGVTFSKPYLNIITTTVPIKRFRRRSGKQRSNKRSCNRRSLVFNFKEIPEYHWISSPSHVDIGYCAGQCQSRSPMHGQHATLHFQLFERGVVKKRPCCAPHEYKDFEYLYKNGTKLTQGKWRNVIAIDCSCQ